MEAKKILIDISPRTYEHPNDRAALTVLQSLPGLDRLVAMMINLTSGKSLRLLFLASSVKAGEKQFPRVYRLAGEAAHVLDMETPELFVTQSPAFNAGTYGVETPFIMVNSALTDALDDEELLAVIGHELSHIKSGHVLYKTLLWLITTIGINALGALGGIGAQAALLAVLAALREWDRKSELSADRGGLLSVQNPDAAYRLLMKMAGGSRIGEMNINEFFLQADEYEKGGDLLDSVHKILNLAQMTHPFPVIRLKELKMWVDTGKYSRILEGGYTRGSDKVSEPVKDLYEAAQAYRDEFERSEDPLAQSLKSFGKTVEKAAAEAGKSVDNFLKTLFPGSGDGGL
ncbi:MAG: M48 family metallopeptidase [Spirochaetales bacterium]|nr:M48 family metallopeptidase [Spirochaetales bacterium]